MIEELYKLSKQYNKPLYELQEIWEEIKEINKAMDKLTFAISHGLNLNLWVEYFVKKEQND